MLLVAAWGHYGLLLSLPFSLPLFFSPSLSLSSSSLSLSLALSFVLPPLSLSPSLSLSLCPSLNQPLSPLLLPRLPSLLPQHSHPSSQWVSHSAGLHHVEINDNFPKHFRQIVLVQSGGKS